MKSKQLILCFALFICCSSSLLNLNTLKMVPSTTSQGAAVEFTFTFQLETGFSSGSISINFPKEIVNFGSQPACLVSVGGQPFVNKQCIFDLSANSVKLNDQVYADSYVISLTGITNPLNVPSSGRFTVQIFKIGNLYPSESAQTDFMAFTPPASSLNNLDLMPNADLVQLPPNYIRAPNQFQWNFTTQGNYPSGMTIRFIVPSGFDAERPICQAVVIRHGVETNVTLFSKSSPFNNVVDCLNYPNPIVANTPIKFNLLSINSPQYAGMFSGFTIQIVNGLFPQTLETFTNNSTLTIVPQSMSVGPSGIILSKKENVNITFQVNVTHAVSYPSQVVITFTNDWVLSSNCQVVSGLVDFNSTVSLSCVKDGSYPRYIISNFQTATPGVPILVSTSLTSPQVGNQDYNVAFSTWDLGLNGEIDRANLSINVNSTAGSAQIFQFYAFSNDSSFLPGDTKALHFSFNLNYSWPDSSYTPLFEIEILPKIPDPFVNFNTQLRCIINGVQASSCSFASDRLDRSVLLVSPVLNQAFSYIYLVVSGYDSNTGDDVGLQFPFNVNNYRAILTVKRDALNNVAPTHVFVGNFSNNPSDFSNSTLVPIISVFGQKSPLKFTFVSPINLANQANYVLKIQLNTSTIYNTSLIGNKKSPYSCVAEGGSKVFCLIGNSETSNLPVIYVYGIVAQQFEKVKIYFANWCLKSTSTQLSNTFIAWIEEVAPGRFGHLLSNFNVTNPSLQTPVNLTIATSLSNYGTQTSSQSVSSDDTKIGQIVNTNITFQVQTAKPDYVILEFFDGLKILQTGFNGSFAYFSSSNQILHPWPDNSGQAFTETVTIPAGYLQNSVNVGPSNVTVKVVKNATITELFNVTLTNTLFSSSSASSLQGSFGPDASETNIIMNANTLFETALILTPIPDGSCATIKYTGISLANEIPGFQTCGISGLSSLAKCIILNSTAVQIQGISGLNSASNTFSVFNRFFANVSSGSTADIVISFNPDCSASSMTTNIVSSAFTFNSSLKAGTLKFKSSSAAIFNGNVQPFEIDLNVPQTTNLHDLLIQVPSCVVPTSNFPSCSISGNQVPCTFNSQTRIFNLTVSSLNGFVPIVLSTLYSDVNGLNFSTCDGGLYNLNVSDDTSAGFTHYFRIPKRENSFVFLNSTRKIKNENYEDGILSVSFAASDDIGSSSIHIQLKSNGLGAAFSPVLQAKPHNSDNKIPCQVFGLTNTNPAECFIVTFNGNPQIEIEADGLTANQDVSVLLYDVQNLAYLSQNSYEVEVSIFNSTGLIYFHTQRIKDCLVSATISQTTETYNSPLGFPSGTNLGSVADLTLSLTLTSTLDIGSVIIVNVPKEIPFSSSSLSSSSANNLDYFILGNEGKAFIWNTAALSGNVQITIPGLQVPKSTLDHDVLFNTTLVYSNGSALETREHAFLMAATASLVGSISSISLKPDGIDASEFNFGHGRKGVWGLLEFTLTNPINVGGSILITVGPVLNYNFSSQCSAIDVGASVSGLLSAFNSSDVVCQANANNLTVFVDNAVAAGATVRLMVNFDTSVEYVDHIDVNISTFCHVFDGNTDFFKIDNGTANIARVADGNFAIPIDITQSFNVKSLITAGKKAGMKFSIYASQAFPANSLLTLTLPAADFFGQGTGFSLDPQIAYYCTVSQGGTKIPCSVSVAAGNVATFTFGGSLSIGSFCLTFNTEGTTSASIGIPFPASPGKYQLSFSLSDGASYQNQTKFLLEVAGPSFNFFDMRNLVPDFESTTGLKLSFALKDTVSDGKICLSLYLDQSANTYYSHDQTAVPIDFISSHSSIQNCIFFSGSEAGFSNGYFNERIECSIVSSLVGNTTVNVTIFKVSPSTSSSSPYHFLFPASLAYKDASGSVVLTSYSSHNYEFKNVASGIVPQIAVNKTGGTNAAETSSDIDLIIAQNCGDLEVDDAILFTFERTSFGPSVNGPLALVGAPNNLNFKYLPFINGLLFQVTASLANATEIRVGPFALNLGYMGITPAANFSCIPQFKEPTVASNSQGASALASVSDYTDTANFKISPINKVYGANTDLNITLSFTIPNVKKISIDFSNLWQLVDGSFCKNMEGSFSPVSYCNFNANSLDIVLTFPSEGTTTNIGIQTFNGTHSAVNPAADLSAVNYGISFSAFENGLTASNSDGLIAQNSAALTYSSAVGDLIADNTLPVTSLYPLFDKLAWNIELNQNFPGLTFLSFSVSLNIPANSVLNVDFLFNLYVVDTISGTNSGDYTGSLICLVNATAYPCSSSPNSLTISSLPALNLQYPTKFYVGFYSHSLVPFQVLSKPFQTFLLTFNDSTGSTIIKQETEYFHTFPKALNGISVKAASKVAGDLNYFQIAVQDTNTIATADNYTILVELESGDSSKPGFSIDSLGSGSYLTGGDGIALPCVNLVNSSDLIRCIFVEGTPLAAQKLNPTIAIEVQNVQANSAINVGVTGISNPANNLTDAIMGIYVFASNGTLIGYNKTNVFNTGEGFVNSAAPTLNFNDFYSVKSDYTLTLASGTFEPNDVLIYESIDDLSTSNIVFSSTGINLRAVNASGNSFFFKIVALPDTFTSSSDYVSQDFFLTSKLAASPDVRIHHISADGLTSSILTLPTTNDQVDNNFGVATTSTIGSFKVSLMSTDTSQNAAVASTGFFAHFSLDFSALSAVSLDNVKKGAFVTISVHADFTANDQLDTCSVDNRIFVSNDPSCPVSCKVIADGASKLFQITNFSSISFTTGNLLYRATVPVASNSNNAVTVSFYGAGTPLASLTNPFAKILTTITPPTAYESSPVIIDAIQQTQFGKTSDTEWTFNAMLMHTTQSGSFSITTFTFNFDASVDFSGISSAQAKYVPQTSFSSCTNTGNNFVCNVAAESISYDSVNNPFPPTPIILQITFSSSKTIPTAYPINFLKIQVEYTDGTSTTTEVHENLAYLFDSNLNGAISNTLAASNSISWTSTSPGLPSLLNIGFTNLAVPISSQNPIAIQFIGSTSQSAQSQKIPCSADYAIGSVNCYFVKAGAVYRLDTLIIIPTATIVSGGTVSFQSFAFTVPSTMYTGYEIFSININDNLDIFASVSSLTHQHILEQTQQKSVSATLAASFANNVLTVSNGASILSGNWLTLDFGNQVSLTPNFVSDLSKFANTASNTNTFQHSLVFISKSRVLAFCQVGSDTDKVQITFSDGLFMHDTNSASLNVQLSGADLSNDLTNSVSITSVDGVLNLNLRKLYGNGAKNHVQGFVYSFNIGGFNIGNNGIVSLSIGDIQRTSATNSPKSCAAFIGNKILNCSHTIASSNTIVLNATNVQGMIPKNSNIDIVLAGYFNINSSSSSYGAQISDTTSIIKYGNLSNPNPFSFTGGDFHTFGNFSVHKCKDKAAFQVPNSHVFDFKAAGDLSNIDVILSSALTLQGKLYCEVSEIFDTALPVFRPAISSGEFPCSIDVAKTNISITNLALKNGGFYRVLIADISSNTGLIKATGSFLTSITTSSFSNQAISQINFKFNSPSMADVSNALNGPVIPNINNPNVNNFYITSKESSAAKVLIFNFKADLYSGFGNIEVEFYNEKGCGATCNWQTDQTLFDSNPNDGDEIQCSLTRSNTYFDYSAAGAVCRYYHGTTTSNPKIRISFVAVIPQNSLVTLALYGVKAQSKILPISIQINNRHIVRGDFTQFSSSYLFYSSLFSSIVNASPGSATGAWSIGGTSGTNLFGQNGVIVNLNLQTTLDLHLGDKIQVQLPNALSCNMVNNLQYTFQGATLPVLVHDSLRNIFIGSIPSDFSIASTGDDLQFTVNNPSHLAPCTNYNWDVKVDLFTNYMKTVDFGTLNYPQATTANYSTAVVSVPATPVVGSFAKVNITYSIPSNVYGAGITANVTFLNGNVQVLKCNKAVQSQNTLSNCNVVQRSNSVIQSSIYPSSFSFEVQLKFAVSGVFDLKLELSDASGLLLHSQTDSQTITTQAAIVNPLNVQLFNRFPIGNLYSIENSFTIPDSSSKRLVFGFNTPFDFNSSTSNITLQSSNDVFGISGNGSKLHCYIEVFGANMQLAKTFGSNCTESGSGMNLDFFTPQTISSLTYIQIVVERNLLSDNPQKLFNFAAAPFFLNFSIGNTFTFFKNNILFVPPTAEFSSFSYGFSDNSANSKNNFIDFNMISDLTLPVYQDSQAELSSHWEIEFSGDSFPQNFNFGTFPQHVYFSKIASCNPTESVLIFPGNSASQNWKLKILANAVTAGSLFNYLAPFIENGIQGKPNSFKVSYIFASSRSHHIPFAKVSHVFRNGQIGAAVVPVASTGTLTGSNFFNSQTTLDFRFAISNTLSTSELFSLLIKVGKQWKPDSDFCGVTFGGWVSTYYSSKSVAMWTLKATSAVTGNVNLMAANFNTGFTTSNLNFNISTFTAGLPIQALTFNPFNLTSSSLSFGNTLSQQYANSEVKTNLQFSGGNDIPSNSIIQIKLKNQFLSSNFDLIGGGDCVITAGLTSSSGIPKCSQGENNTLFVKGFDAISSNAAVSLSILSQTNASGTPYSFEVSVLYKNAVLFNSTLATISNNLNNVYSVNSTNIIHSSVNRINNQNSAIEFSLIINSTNFQTQTADNNFVITFNSQNLGFNNNKLYCEMLNQNNFWVPTPCTLTSSFTSESNFALPVTVMFNVSSYVLTAGQEYKFRINTVFSNGKSGFAFSDESTLKKFTVDLYNPTLFEESIGQLVSAPDANYVNSFGFETFHHAVNSTGLSVVSVNLALNLQVGDSLQLCFPSSYNGNTIWANNLGIDLSVYIQATDPNQIPCERFFGETFISQQPIKCFLNVVGSNIHIEVQPISASITANTAFKLVLLGIKTPVSFQSAPVIMSILRKQDSKFQLGGKIASKTQILTLSSTSYQWNYIAKGSSFSANDTQVTHPSNHYFSTDEAVNIGDIFVLKYPLIYMSIVPPIDASSGVLSLLFPKTQVAAYLSSQSAASATIKVSGNNPIGIPTINPNVNYSAYYANGTLAGYQVTPVQLTPLNSIVTIKELEFNSELTPNGTLLKNRINKVRIYVSNSWDITQTQFLVIKAQGISNFNGKCNATLDLPLSQRAGVIPPGFDCDLSVQGNITLTKSNYFDSAFNYSASSLTNLYSVSVYISVDTFVADTETNFTVVAYSFVSNISFSANFNGSLNYSSVAHPSFYNFDIEDQIENYAAINKIRFLYKPTVPQNVSRAILRMPSNFVPLASNLLNLTCKISGQNLLYTKQASLSSNSDITVEFNPFNLSSVMVECTNAFGPFFSQPLEVSFNNDVKVFTYSSDNLQLEYDRSRTPVLYRGRAKDVKVDLGKFNMTTSRAIFNVTTGSAGIRKGYSNSVDPRWSKIVFSFLFSDFSTDLGTGLNDGDTLGCLQLSPNQPIQNMIQGNVSCVLRLGLNSQNAKIEITGHEEILANNASSFMILGLNSPDPSVLGNVTFIVYEFYQSFKGLVIAPFFTTALKRVIPVYQNGGNAVAIMSKNSSSLFTNYSIDSNQDYLSTGDMVVLTFDTNIFDINVKSNLITSNNSCIKVWTFPQQRTIIANAICNTSDNWINISNVLIQPYNVQTGNYPIYVLAINKTGFHEQTEYVSYVLSNLQTPVLNTSLFNVIWDNLEGGKFHPNTTIGIMLPNTTSNRGVIDIIFPNGLNNNARRILTAEPINLGTNFGNFGLTNPSCSVLTYNTSSNCTIQNSFTIRVYLNAPQNFNTSQKLYVSISNLIYPNTTEANTYINARVYFSDTRLDSQISYQYLVPTFTPRGLTPCSLNVTSEYSNTVNSGDLTIGVNCPSPLEKFSVLNIGIADISYNANPSLVCISNGLYLSSSSCPIVPSNSLHDQYVQVSLETEPSVSNFNIVLKNIVGLQAGLHNVTLNITSRGLRFAKEQSIATFSTNNTLNLLDPLTLTPSLTVTSRNPTAKSDYVFSILKDLRLSRTFRSKIIFDPIYIGSLTQSTCSVGGVNGTFAVSDYYNNKSIFTDVNCVISGNQVITSVPLQALLSDNIVIVIKNVLNPKESQNALFEFHFANISNNVASLVWKRALNMFVTVDTLIKPFIVNVSADSFSVGTVANYNFTLNTFYNDSGSGIFNEVIDPRINISNYQSLTSDLMTSGTVSINGNSITQTGNYSFEVGSPKTISVSRVSNPSLPLFCANDTAGDLQKFSISAIDKSDTVLYKTFDVLNPNKVCNDYDELRNSIIVTGNTTLNSGVLNIFYISISAPNTGTLSLVPSTNQEGITINPANIVFGDGITNISFTIFPSALPQYTYLDAILSFSKTDNLNEYANLAPIELTIDRSHLVTIVNVNPLNEIKYFNIPYYFQISTAAPPATNLTISINNNNAEVIVSPNTVTLSSTDYSELVSIKVGSLFSGSSLTLGFTLTFGDANLYTYALSQDNMTVLVSNIQNSSLSISGINVNASKTTAQLSVETNQPATIYYLFLHNGAPVPDSSSAQAFLATPGAISSGSLLSPPTGTQFITVVSTQNLVASTMYSFYCIADNTLQLVGGTLNFNTSNLEEAVTFTLSFSSPVNATQVISVLSEETGIPFSQFQVLSGSVSRRLQSQQQYYLTLAIVPSPTSSTVITNLLPSLNSPSLKNTLAGAFPEFWAGQDISVSTVQATIPQFVLMPSVISYSYYNATISMSLLEQGGVYALRVKRDSPNVPKYSGNPSGIQIINNQNHIGETVEEYDVSWCTSLTNVQNCTIVFDDFKSNSVYDIYFAPFAAVPYSPPPVGSFDQIKSLNFTSPVNPYVEKQ